MTAALGDGFGNPSSAHSIGQRAAYLLHDARHQVATALGAKAQEVVFTSGGTESDILAIRGVLRAIPHRQHVVITAIEHDAILSVARQLETEGHEITVLPVDCNGQIDLADLEDALRADTALASIMLANNETGILLPVAAAADICRRHGVLVHTDAVQAFGKIPIDVRALGVDLLSVSSHKLHGPKGCGALVVREGLQIDALMVGGHQEKDRRGGTENVPGIVGFATAATCATSIDDDGHSRIKRLRDGFETTLCAARPDTYVIGANVPRLPNTACLAFADCSSEAILVALNERGICASGGSACHSGSLEPSGVLSAMGIEPRLALGAVRFSLSRYTTPEEIDTACDVIVETVNKLR